LEACATPTEEAWPAAAVRAVGLCFRKGGKVYYFHPGDFPPALGDFVVVETDKGVDIGEVVTLKRRLEPGEEEPTRQVLRPATTGDVRRKQALEQREAQAFRTCEFKINEHGLEMKLIEASYTLDGKRLTFSFVSEARVDFRDLVRDLAQTFRCRIELRQVGVRDQAKLIGGLGPCGRPLCCATFLRDFCSVGIRLAKDQGLSLNPAKISGACDRLMCCLRYEHAQYSEVNRRLPRLGERVERPGAAGEVVERNLLTGAVTLRTEDGKEVVLAEKDLFPEGIKVALTTPSQQRRREERRPQERRPSPRGERREEAPAEAPSPPETAAASPAETTGAEPPAAAVGAQAPEDHHKRAHRKRGPRHRRQPSDPPGASAPAGPGDEGQG
jgi:cell fate regulator YaaT (PSP1 superfamily)